MLEDIISASPIIQFKWYRKGETVLYAIVQYSTSCVWVVAVGAAWSCSGMVLFVGPVDASEGRIRTSKNCVTERNWTQDIGSGTMLEDTSVSPTIKIRWYGRGEGAFYAIVQHSPSCMQVAIIGAVCFRSGVIVSVGLADASDGAIRVVENYVFGENWTQDIGRDIMIENPPSTSPIIKSRWYRRCEKTSYAIVQHSLSYVPATAVGVVCSRLDAVVPVGPTW
jgi:hypothetical protein